MKVIHDVWQFPNACLWITFRLNTTHYWLNLYSLRSWSRFSDCTYGTNSSFFNIKSVFVTISLRIGLSIIFLGTWLILSSMYRLSLNFLGLILEIGTGWKVTYLGSSGWITSTIGDLIGDCSDWGGGGGCVCLCLPFMICSKTLYLGLDWSSSIMWLTISGSMPICTMYLSLTCQFSYLNWVWGNDFWWMIL